MKLLFLLLSFIAINSFAQNAPKPYGELPTRRQLAWHDLEMYGLVHFTPTTFENKEWGYGDADPKIFNPTNFNATQIVVAAKAGGLKGIILVAKHHDGFALWPTKTTDYNITKSPFRNGQGDMVKEMELAARKQGLKFGIYCSPWDRNNGAYGTAEYLKIYQAQLKELYSNYGELFMSWHDGANGGDGYYGGAKEKRSIDNTTYYDWNNTWQITRQMQPMANIFSDIGWDVRWAGNEDGSVNKTSWATITPEPAKGMNVAVPGQSNYVINPTGTRNGKFWMPAECDVPLRQGWFFHANEKPKSVAKLFDLYLKSVGRGANLDLGLAPDTRGQLHEDDVANLKAFGKMVKKTFSNNLAQNATIKASNTRGKNYTSIALTDKSKLTYWATADDVHEAQLLIELKNNPAFDIISLQEYIPLGQRIDNFSIEILAGNKWIKIYAGTSIGAKRLIKFDSPIKTNQVKISLKAPVAITLNKIGLFKTSD